MLIFFLATSASSAPDPRDRFVIHVGLQKVAESGVVAVPLNHKLQTGDRFRLTVRPHQAGYLYLYYRKGQEVGVRLWPAGAGAQPVEAGEEVAVPASGNLRVTADPGQDTIQLFFARTPVADPDALAKPRTPSRIRQIRLRGIDVEPSPGVSVLPAAFVADLDDQGVAVLEIPLGRR